MKHSSKLNGIFIIVFILTFCFPVLVHAQDPGPGPDAGVPIDGGLSLLIAAGIGYGANQIRKKRKEGQQKVK